MSILSKREGSTKVEGKSGYIHLSSYLPPTICVFITILIRSITLHLYFILIGAVPLSPLLCRSKNLVTKKMTEPCDNFRVKMPI